MPLAYGLPHSSSHHFTRTHASLFDVSHMLQHTFGGRRAGEFLARITPSDVCGMAVGEARLSCLLGADGGIVDDCLVTRTGAESWYVVTNAGCREKDVAYLTRELDVFDGRRGESEVEWTRLEGWGLLALQGPEAETVLGNVLLDADRVNLGALGFGQCTVGAITTGQGKAAGPLLISRGGYTGEDGFEIAIAPQYVTAVAESLLCSAGEDKVQLAGLAARDSLRLEAGMCLYGHDLDETTTPVEASLGWIVAKNRRQQGDFHGAKIILPQLQSKAKGGTGVQRRRVGLIVEGPPAREGADIISSDGTHLGQITSGCPSPTLHKNIAMGYIQDGHHQVDTAVQVVVRGKARSAVVVKMPFVASKYKKSETARPALCMVPELLPSDETTVLDMKRWTRVDSLTVDPHHHVVAVSYK